MGKVLAFPNSPFVTADTAGLEVVVAPHGSDLIAWVRTKRGFIILERSDNWRRVLQNGRLYAKRFGIAFSTQWEPLFAGGRLA